ITIEDDVYKTLVGLKEGPGDSFSKVLRRHVYVPAKTNAELLAWHENQPPRRFSAQAKRELVQRLLELLFACDTHLFSIVFSKEEEAVRRLKMSLEDIYHYSYKHFI